MLKGESYTMKKVSNFKSVNFAERIIFLQTNQILLAIWKNIFSQRNASALELHSIIITKCWRQKRTCPKLPMAVNQP